MPAQATAKSVMASAKRLMEVRHFWFSRNRMAEISVPAWPIPIHQTKLTIAKPQPMGMLMPQIPTPLTISQAIEIRTARITRLNASANPASQPMPKGRRENDRGDFVGDRGVGVPRFQHRIQPADFGCVQRRLRRRSCLLQLRIRIAHGRKIRGARAGH